MDRAYERYGRVSQISWSLGYLGLLGYIFAIVSYRLPIGEASIILALIGVFLEPRRLKLPQFLILFGVFLAWSALWSVASQFSGAVFMSLETGVKLWAIAFVAVNVIRTPAQFRFFIVFFIACFAFWPARGAIFNFLRGYTAWDRAIWKFIFENPNDLAALCFLPLSIAWALVATERRGLFRWGALASVVVFPLLILLTQSRGAFLALLVVAGVGFFRHKKKAKAMFLGGAMAVLALAMIPNSAWERFRGVATLTNLENVAEADEEGSAEQRLNIWKTAWIIIKDHPFSGVGLGAYSQAHVRYAA
ncbi:MAG: hypothetical protein HKO65_18300, partial [Gemmatimonadetes bacterium]|nr:hypothetical protein [Gemmatimonadota bacterium]